MQVIGIQSPGIPLITSIGEDQGVISGGGIDEVLGNQDQDVIQEIVPTETAIVPTPTAESDDHASGNEVYLGLLNSEDYCLNCTTYPVQVRVTHYWPPDGGMNCFDFRDGYCVSAMASGLRWENYIGLAVACPMEWPFGSWVEIQGMGSYNCLDRGSMVCNEEYCDVDILSPSIGEFDGRILSAQVHINWNN